MACERCGGLMVIDIFFDLMEAESRMGIDTARCLNCGNFEDTIIRTNRNRARSRVSRHFEPHTVGTRRSSAIQPRSLERAIHTEGASRVPPRSCPLSSWGPLPSKHSCSIPDPSSNLSSIAQTRGGAHERASNRVLWEGPLCNVACTVCSAATGRTSPLILLGGGGGLMDGYGKRVLVIDLSLIHI